MEFFNILYAISFTFILFVIYQIPIKYYLLVSIHLVVVFLLNGVLFDPHYMPDQFRYLFKTEYIRDVIDLKMYIEHIQDFLGVGTVENASILFGVFPIPFISSIYSIAIINFMLYAFLFIFLYKKKILVGNALWFYLFFPSFMIYAGVALRDMWILLFMVLSIYLLYKKHLILSIMISLPLLLIKSQNFYIFILSLVVFQIIKRGVFFSFATLIKIILLFGVFYQVIAFIGIGEINHIRLAMYMEDGGNINNYQALTTQSDLIFQGITGMFYMILKPFPWDSSSALQLFQSFENLFVFYLIIKLIMMQLKVKDEFINFLIVYFFISMVIYGLVIFNYGTAARYRFTFELILIIFSMSIFYKGKTNSTISPKKLDIKI